MADILHPFVRYTYAIHYVDTVPPDLHSEVFEKLRRLSGELYADMALIPNWIHWYSESCRGVIFLLFVISLALTLADYVFPRCLVLRMG